LICVSLGLACLMPAGASSTLVYSTQENSHDAKQKNTHWGSVLVMATVDAHYAAFLAPIYTWMVGGSEQAFALGDADLESFLPSGSLALDLGGGFGMHALPLARRGWKVISIDSSAHLTDELKHHGAGFPIEAIQADLLDFQRYLSPNTTADLILCMGDTLTHLPSPAAVERLIHQVAKSLRPGGRFMATFRDYTQLPAGPSRFIPVRADDTRILTCFLEAHPDDVEVHDLLYTYENRVWKLSVSTYRKLRLLPDMVCNAFKAAGLKPHIMAGPRGMLRLVADA